MLTKVASNMWTEKKSTIKLYNYFLVFFQKTCNYFNKFHQFMVTALWKCGPEALDPSEEDKRLLKHVEGVECLCLGHTRCQVVCLLPQGTVCLRQGHPEQ